MNTVFVITGTLMFGVAIGLAVAVRVINKNDREWRAQLNRLRNAQDNEIMDLNAGWMEFVYRFTGIKPTDKEVDQWTLE